MSPKLHKIRFSFLKRIWPLNEFSSLGEISLTKLVLKEERRSRYSTKRMAFSFLLWSGEEFIAFCSGVLLRLNSPWMELMPKNLKRCPVKTEH
jgi:hypothetical protein